jgi:hypothetical protein
MTWRLPVKCGIDLATDQVVHHHADGDGAAHGGEHLRRAVLFTRASPMPKSKSKSRRKNPPKRVLAADRPVV